VRFDGTGGKTGQTSSVLIDDSNNVSGIGTLAAGATTISGDTVVSNGYHLVVGHSAPINIGNVGELQVLGTAAGDSSTTTARFSADSGGPSHDFLKSRNGAIGSSTIVQDDDELGGLIWYADDGNDFYSSSARIFAAVDGTPGENDVPGRLVFATTADGANSATERMRISSAGSLSLGATAVGGSPGAGSVEFQKDGNNYVRFWDNATATFYMQSNAANAPTTAMKNSDSDSLDITTFQRTNAGGTILGQSRNGLMLISGAPNGSFAVGTSNAKDLVLGTNNTEKLRITSAGKVGINITDPADYTDASGAVLVVGNTSSTATRSGVAIITNTSGIGRLAFGDGAGDPDQWKGLIQYAQSSDTMGFACNGQAVEMSLVGGNLGIAMTPGGSHKLDVTGSAGLSTGTAWTNTSDARIKRDVTTITGATATLKRLRPVSYKYTDQYLSVHSEIDGSKTYHSFVADEYESVFPDAVSDQGDLVKTTPATYYADGDDLPDGKSVGDEKTAETSETLLTNLKQYTPHDLQMFLTAAVQELDARIVALESA
jgi:hypothetical protein